MRICSLVPAATEVLFALGAGESVVGVTHECDWPPEAAERPRVTASLLQTGDLSSAEIDQAVAEAKNQFRSENYGNSGALFYKAVQLAPNDGVAWLGLAASCDRIGRFDLADKAYRQAFRYIGATPEYYNNVGYSYLLRGKLQDARKNFLKAYELAPNDPTVKNNLELLASSVNNIERQG